jgi:hypothetical protein
MWQMIVIGSDPHRNYAGERMNAAAQPRARTGSWDPRRPGQSGELLETVPAAEPSASGCRGLGCGDAGDWDAEG